MAYCQWGLSLLFKLLFKLLLFKLLLLLLLLFSNDDLFWQCKLAPTRTFAKWRLYCSWLLSGERRWFKC